MKKLEGVRYASLITAAFALMGCRTDTSHLPLPHQLPGAVIGSVVENTRYNSRRNKVKASIQPHVDFITKEAALGGGPTFNLTCKVANVSPLNCTKVAQDISQNGQIYSLGSLDEQIEKLTVVFMVHGD